MKIPVKWLSEYVDLAGVSDDALSDALTMSGTENEIVRGESGFEKIVVGEIKKIEKHPNADKLQITKTDVGGKNGGVLQIVCGAPNIEVGQKVPVALVGAEIGEFTIKRAEIRGVESSGMLCSESELGISDDHTGIMILDARSKVGSNLSSALNIGGTVLEAEITPNRGDCLSIIGVAREASAALGKKLKGMKFKKPEVSSKLKMDVEIDEKNLCPRYIAKVVEGVKICPSPKWMQDCLSSSGVQPINNIVDVTNYVMLEWGQPLHAFDASKISGKIIVRKAKDKEVLETLDGVKRTLAGSNLVIADSKKAIALAGVMGGANSEVTEKTKNIVLEAAVFDGTSIRKTAQKLGLRSEASNRFEKGIPLALPEIAIERAAELMAETGGGKVGENTDVLSKWIWLQHIGIESAELDKFLGVHVPDQKILSILNSLGFAAKKFDFKEEARTHIGKPYVLGASYKTHGDMAFDCSYLTDYIYSLIGKFIGYTSLAQYELGTPVKNNDLKPGDILFVKGVIDKSPRDHYYTPDGNGGYEKVMLEKPKEVGHNALYVGNGRIIHASQYSYDPKAKKWIKRKTKEVIEESADVFLKNPEYLGARRYISDPEDLITVDVPWWRLDVKIPEDIYEEVGRIYGYEKFPLKLPAGELPVGADDVKQKLVKAFKESLTAMGFSEVINYSFVSAKMLINSGGDPKKALRISNPISPEQEYMRTNLIGSILFDASVNQDNSSEINIFEIASKYLPVSGEELPNEGTTLCILSKSRNKRNDDGFKKVKGALDAAFRKMNLEKLDYVSEKAARGSVFSENRAAEVRYSGEKIGVIGEISEKAKASFNLKHDFAVAEINIEKQAADFGRPVEYESISKYPSAQRDVNILVDENITAKKIMDLLLKHKAPNLKSYEITDIYEGKELPEGKKSVTIRLTFGSDARTLLEDEIEKETGGIVGLFEKIGAKKRV